MDLFCFVLIWVVLATLNYGHLRWQEFEYWDGYYKLQRVDFWCLTGSSITGPICFLGLIVSCLHNRSAFNVIYSDPNDDSEWTDVAWKHRLHYQWGKVNKWIPK